MNVSKAAQALSGLGGAKWDLHFKARKLEREGRDVLALTIGEPDCAMSAEILPALDAALAKGRVGYSNGQGEPALLGALADRYTKNRGRAFSPRNFLALPGTQTALYVLLNGLVDPGDEVIVFDPCYATYEGLIVSSGAEVVLSPLDPAADFAIDFDALERRLTDRTRAILLNNPHNPTGAVMDEAACRRLGDLAVERGIWLICDEVYEDLILDKTAFCSPMQFPEYTAHCVACASISKSHAAPGLRSGWAVGPEEIIAALIPLAETMLFGNQPFIADATVAALKGDGATAENLRQTLATRADLVASILGQSRALRVSKPKAGMFVLVEVSETGLTGYDFACDLLEQHSVALMPGSSFGSVAGDWVRLSLTHGEEKLREACTRMAGFADALMAGKA
ncbi:MAG: pyridoxal phosphate-dependent aminotransferase [Alphaproteobacteria bacterium]